MDAPGAPVCRPILTQTGSQALTGQSLPSAPSQLSRSDDPPSLLSTSYPALRPSLSTPSLASAQSPKSLEPSAHSAGTVRFSSDTIRLRALLEEQRRVSEELASALQKVCEKHALEEFQHVYLIVWLPQFHGVVSTNVHDMISCGHAALAALPTRLHSRREFLDYMHGVGPCAYLSFWPTTQDDTGVKPKGTAKLSTFLMDEKIEYQLTKEIVHVPCRNAGNLAVFIRSLEEKIKSKRVLYDLATFNCCTVVKSALKECGSSMVESDGGIADLLAKDRPLQVLEICKNLKGSAVLPEHVIQPPARDQFVHFNFDPVGVEFFLDSGKAVPVYDPDLVDPTLTLFFRYMIQVTRSTVNIQKSLCDNTHVPTSATFTCEVMAINASQWTVFLRLMREVQSLSAECPKVPAYEDPSLPRQTLIAMTQYLRQLAIVPQFASSSAFTLFCKAGVLTTQPIRSSFGQPEFELLKKISDWKKLLNLNSSDYKCPNPKCTGFVDFDALRCGYCGAAMN